MSEPIHPVGPDTATDGSLAVCWSCKGPVDRRALFCHTCSAVQPPHGIDHFTRLGLAPRFDLAPEDIERNYFGFQRIVHPDRFASKSSREKALSQAHAAALNDAYETLRDPIARAVHLLELHGAAMPGEDHTVKDPTLLMAAMEDREALSEADSVADVDRVIARAQSDFDRVQGELSGHFARDELTAAQKAVLRLRYLSKLRTEAQARRARIGKS